MKISLQKKTDLPLHIFAAARMFIIFLIFWFVPVGMVALAENHAQAASEESVDGTVVTFTNTKNTSPDLYVTKSIQTSSEDETDYSNVEFTFILYLDGAVARQTEYTVWDENGNQVFRYEDGTESTEEKSNAVAYRTSRYGVFTLKAGQTARFSSPGAGTSYEVEEEEMDGFTQIIPTGGAKAVGTIASDGSVAAFTNLVTADKETQKSGIRIYKTASFPEGWIQPESPAFSFTITVNNEELALEEYEVYDTDTASFKENRTTDTDGNFTLYAGEYALFETDSNVDYQITENETEGWRITTEESVSGSTGESIQTVIFNNATAAFIVTKTLAEGTEETGDTFTFLLSDGTGTAMTGASYWVYDIYGNPQYDENGEIRSCKTGTDGSFLLEAGQAAVFYGMEAGTQYSVSEKPATGWNQVIPASVTGYHGKTVSDAVEILPFENETVDLTGTLTVTKFVKNASALSAPAEDEFIFCIYDADDSPVANAVYSVTIGSEVYTYKTDAAGFFSLHAGETAVFSSLMYGAYSVKELTVPERTHETYEFASLTVTDGEISTVYEEDGAIGMLDEDGLAFEYTNTYTAPSSITIYKYQSNGLTSLSGVTFTLADADGTVFQEQTTGEDGRVLFDNLSAGTYIVTETSTQDGYTALVNSFAITVPRTMTKDEVKAEGTDTSDAIWRTDTNLWYFFDVTYNITNSAVLNLPEAGGNGWFVPVIVGAVILTSTSVAVVWNSGKRKMEKSGGRNRKTVLQFRRRSVILKSGVRDKQNGGRENSARDKQNEVKRK